MTDEQRARLRRSAEEAGVGSWEQVHVQELAGELKHDIQAEYTIVIATKGHDVLIGAQIPRHELLKAILGHILATLDSEEATVIDLREHD